MVKHIEGYPSTVSAWTEAARRCKTSHFFSVDADNLVFDDFSWQVPSFTQNDPRIHVWRCLNPINKLVYGHGAIKLWSVKNILAEADQDQPTWLDFTCQLSKYGFMIQPEVASFTQFNCTAEESFVSAFKECLKMSTGQTKYAHAQSDPDLLFRLAAWANFGWQEPFGVQCLLGARQAILLKLENQVVPPSKFTAAFRLELWRSYSDQSSHMGLVVDYGTKLKSYGFPIFDQSQPPWAPEFDQDLHWLKQTLSRSEIYRASPASKLTWGS